MGLLELNLDKVPDAILLDEGEHKLRVNSVEERENKNGKHYLAISYASTDKPDADLLYDNVYLPDGDDERKDNVKKRFLNIILDAFGVQVTKGSLNTDDMLGCTGFLIVKHTKRDGITRAEIDSYSTGE